MSWTTRITEFAKDVRQESTLVSWPTRNELRDSTIVVIATVIIITIFVYIVDWVLRLGMSTLLH